MSYRIGLVLSRAGLNDVQLTLMAHHVQEVARTLAPVLPTLLLAPVEYHNNQSQPTPSVIAKTAKAAKPLVDKLGSWLVVEYLRVAEVSAVALALRDADECWCVTAPGNSENALRARRVHQIAQGFRDSPKFKLLQYWAELPPDLIPSIDRKKKPALKG